PRLLRQVVVEVVQDDEVRPGRPGRRRRHLSVDDGDHALGLEPAYPRGDLGGEGGLADSAHPVDDEPAAARAGQVGGPATAFGRTDGQRCPVVGLASELLAWRAACLTLTGRGVARLTSFSGDLPGPDVRAAGISCGRRT